MSRTVALLDAAARFFGTIDRERLYAVILCGEMVVDGSIIRDPKKRVSQNAILEIRKRRFVSRGGLKLAHALEVFAYEVKAAVALDIGSSAGGFTDCLLQAGAIAVHAVDVGHNQLDFRLRSDARVIVHERTNIMDTRLLDPVPDFAVCDVSFRSLRRLCAHAASLTRRKEVIALVKPQFETRGRDPDFDGVVRDVDKLAEILECLLADLAAEGIHARLGVESPIRGRKGNREFLFLFTMLPGDTGPDAWRFSDLTPFPLKE